MEVLESVFRVGLRMNRKGFPSARDLVHTEVEINKK